MVKSPSCNAGAMGLIPGQGTKILHAEQPSPCAATVEPVHLGARETQLETVCTARKDPA